MGAVAKADSSQTNREFFESFQTQRKSISSLGCGLILLFVLSGCGRAPASVSGKLTLDGKATGRQQSGSSHHYVLSGVGWRSGCGPRRRSGPIPARDRRKVGLTPGKYTVIVAATESAPKAKGDMPNKRLITPTEYTDPKKTKLHAEVRPGSNTFDFDLTSGAKS